MGLGFEPVSHLCRTGMFIILFVAASASSDVYTDECMSSLQTYKYRLDVLTDSFDE